MRERKKRAHVLFLLFMVVVTQSTLQAQNSLLGVIVDAKEKVPLFGASIYFPDLKIGTVANAEGKYKLNKLPKGKFSVTIKYIGYTSLNQVIELEGEQKIDFELTEGVVESKEFIVTGVSQATERSRTPTPVTLISKTTLLQSNSTNLIDALSKQPGVSQLSTGPGISKPVIRGLGFNRVVVVNDGIRQEGQQWGDEHGIEIDEYSVNSVEILKGPASLRYGSDAMAGVLNFISAPTASEGEIKGNLLANYQSNSTLMGYSVNLNGNQRSLLWDIRYSLKQSGNYQNNYDGKVFNSGFNEKNLSGMLGKSGKWGFMHFHGSAYHMNLGIPEGERDSSSGQFTKEVAQNDSVLVTEIAGNSDLNGFSLFNPRQQIKHYKAVMNTNLVAGRGRVGILLGFQQNHRQELSDVLNPTLVGLDFLLQTLHFDLAYVLPEIKNWNVSFGLSGMNQDSKNKGFEFLIPEYNLVDLGAFAILKKSINKFDISGGLRIDTRKQSGNSLFLDSMGMVSESANLDTNEKFIAFTKNFLGVSGSLGATYQFSEYLLTKFNISRGYRAPNIAELGSNGEHEGTLRYELGNLNLKPESSWQYDLEFGLNSEHFSAELNLFNNRISRFIFPRKLLSSTGSDSLTNGISTFKFDAASANLRGGEFSFDLHPHPLDWLHFENSFSLVQAELLQQSDSTRYLPFTPATRINSEIRANAKKIGKHLRNAYFKFETEHFFEQNRIYSAAQTESYTSSYTLFNMGMGSDFISKKQQVIFSLFVGITNLTDVAYQSHLSRLKYAPINYNNGRTGIFNMGRNVSFKLIIPIQFKQIRN